MGYSFSVLIAVMSAKYPSLIFPRFSKLNISAGLVLVSSTNLSIGIFRSLNSVIRIGSAVSSPGKPDGAFG